MSDAGYSMLGAGAWGWPREMLWGGRWEGGSCLGMHVRIKDFKIKKKKKEKKRSCGTYTQWNFKKNFNWRLITLRYYSGFCHRLTWISHGCTCVPHPEPSSHLPPHPIFQGHPSSLALSTLSHASNLHWRSVSHMIIYMFQCYSLRSSHPHLLPQSPKDCSLHLCLFCCLEYWVIITIFLNSIYMH